VKLGADWLDVPEPVAALLRDHLRDRSSATTAAIPASPWLFPGQLAGEHRSYRRLVHVLHQLGIPARASRLAPWPEPPPLAPTPPPGNGGRSSPPRWESRQAQRCATRSPAVPTGPPMPPADAPPPRTTRRRNAAARGRISGQPEPPAGGAIHAGGVAAV